MTFAIGKKKLVILAAIAAAVLLAARKALASSAPDDPYLGDEFDDAPSGEVIFEGEGLKVNGKEVAADPAYLDGGGTFHDGALPADYTPGMFD